MSGTSRERFLQTINHQDPGDVVVDLGAASTTGIHAEALSNLRRYLGLSLKGRPTATLSALRRGGRRDEEGSLELT